jgi:hypothetical protein
LIRYRKQWLFAGVVCCAVFFAPIRFESNALFYIHLMDASHLPAFFALTLFAHAFWPWETTPCRRRLFAAGAVAAVSGAIEIVQPLTGRTMGLTDFINGMMGILIALAFLAARRTHFRLLLIPIAAACVMTAFLPAWHESAGMRWRAANFPLLADFETDHELRLWVGTGLGNVRNDGAALDRIRQHAARGEWSLRVVTTTSSPWPGVRLLNGGQNWLGKKALAFEVWNDGPAFTLSIRIDDDFPHQQYHDRYNDSFEILPGANHISIPTADIATKPKNRPLNLAAIERTILYVNAPSTEHTFFIDHMRLE